MRAEYNATCDIYPGPPWSAETQPIAVDVPCRFVLANMIKGTTGPFNATVGWVTVDVEPPATQWASQLDGMLILDYGSSSRIVIKGSSPMELFTFFVEAITPDEGRPYWRALVTTYPLTDGT